ncbi:MAG: DNA starvation/stationary phase protection protein Dps [Gemmatimonadota bacterium]
MTSRTSIDVAPPTRAKMIDLLNQQLADTADLYSQTKQAHWNVKGPQFIALHELFDSLAEGLEEHIDTIAERITALGGTALGTSRETAQASRLKEFPIGPIQGPDALKALIARYAAVARTTRAAIDTADKAGDKDTADLFTAASRYLDKSLWFLEAHLQ